MKIRYLVQLLMPLVLISAWTTGCAKKGDAVQPRKERVINVRTQPAEKTAQRPSIEAAGTLNPREVVTVSAEISGLIRELRVDNGSPVAKGQVLAVIDSADYSLAVKQAEAALKQAEANLTNTRLEYKRKEALYKDQLVTRQQFDDVSARLAVNDAEVERARLAVSLAAQKLSRTKIYSPISGAVMEKKLCQGDYADSGKALLTITCNNPLKLAFPVTEKDLGRLKPGQEVSFRVDAAPGRTFSGSISMIYPNLDERTRTVQVEARVENPDGLLKPGLFANVTLFTGARRDIVVVPVNAILYEGDKTRVFVVEDDTARERVVRIGQKYGETSEILEGVKEGEQVVSVGQQNLHEGAKVNVAR